MALIILQLCGASHLRLSEYVWILFEDAEFLALRCRQIRIQVTGMPATESVTMYPWSG
jgi:hypothetical protein